MPEQNEPQINEAQIKAALTAARDLSTIKDARRQYWIPRQADLSERSEILANRRTVKNLLSSSLARAPLP